MKLEPGQGLGMEKKGQAERISQGALEKGVDRQMLNLPCDPQGEHPEGWRMLPWGQWLHKGGAQ